jgi:hypothetical protein
MGHSSWNMVVQWIYSPQALESWLRSPKHDFSGFHQALIPKVRATEKLVYKHHL